MWSCGELVDQGGGSSWDSSIAVLPDCSFLENCIGESNRHLSGLSCHKNKGIFCLTMHDDIGFSGDQWEAMD